MSRTQRWVTVLSTIVTLVGGLIMHPRSASASSARGLTTQPESCWYNDEEVLYPIAIDVGDDEACRTLSESEAIQACQDFVDEACEQVGDWYQVRSTNCGAPDTYYDGVLFCWN
jgi:hypothetical protein